MYVPAERNFLSVIENPQQLKFLPAPLFTFLEEFERSKTELTEAIQLPINNIRFEYQRQHKISYIKGIDFKLKLAQASSGIQSLLPLFLVSKNLAYSILEKKESNIEEQSIEEKQNKRKAIESILTDKSLSDSLRNRYLEMLYSVYENGRLINIVEEMEQNLFPESQRNLLNKLLEFNNLTKENQLLITTHSPYLLNYLTIAIKGGEIKKTLLDKGLKHNDQLQKVVPINSCIFSEDVNVYQLTDEGEIKLLPTYEGLPSDENYLNNFLAETNELFDHLLELEEELDD
jgi:predicted ATPase